MLFYLGKGTEFRKEDCKEYKKKDAALKAMVKTEDGTIWDESGQIIASIKDKEVVLAGALETAVDGSVRVFDKDNHQIGKIDADAVEEVVNAGAENSTREDTESVIGVENAEEMKKTTQVNKTRENEADTEPEREDNDIIIPQGTMKVTVTCDGTLNLRRSAEWGNKNICGRAAKGQFYYVKAIHTVQGKKIVQTIDDIYLSGQPEHVQLENI